MEHRNLKWRPPAETVETDQLLATHYARMLQWAIGLARGDRSKAEEIVQEFCLYVTTVKPDLSGVGNLDGYLYTCLRHIYLSSLARASREALRLVSVEDFVVCFGSVQPTGGGPAAKTERSSPHLHLRSVAQGIVKERQLFYSSLFSWVRQARNS